MRKITLLKFACTFLLVLFMASCSNKQSYLKYIPKNTSMLVSVDANSLIKKADLENTSVKEEFDKSLEESEFSLKSVDFINKIIADPSISGIDITSSIYFFNHQELLDDAPVVLFKAYDEDKIIEMIEVLGDELKAKDIIKKSDFNICLIDTRTYFVFNNSMFMILEKPYSKNDDQFIAEVETFMNGCDESILQNELYNKMSTLNGDIKFYILAEAFDSKDLRKFKKELKSFSPNISFDDISDLGLYGSLLFTENDIELLTNISWSNKEFIKSLQESKLSSPPIKSANLSKFPASAAALLSMGVDGEMSMQQEGSEDALKELIGNDMYLMAANIIKAIDGDIVAALLDFDGSYPTGLAYVELINDDYFQTLVALASTTGMLQEDEAGDNRYIIKNIYRGMNVYFGIIDENVLYFTNSNEAYENIGEDYDESIYDNAYDINLEEQSLFFVLNSAVILNKLGLSKDLNNAIGGNRNTKKICNQFINDLDFVECGISFTDEICIQANASLQIENSNTLAYLIKFFDTINQNN